MAGNTRRTGQLIKRGGSWLIRLYVGIDPETGKRKFINKSVRGTKTEAQAVLTKLQRDRDTGVLIEETKMKVSEYLAHWLKVAVKPKVRGRTHDDYTWHVDQRINPEIGDRRVSTLTPVAVQSLYAGMQERGLAARSVRYTAAVLHAALRQAVRWRMIAVNP